MGLGVFNFELVPSPFCRSNEYCTVNERTEAWLVRPNSLLEIPKLPYKRTPQRQSPRLNFLFPRDYNNASGKLPLTSAYVNWILASEGCFLLGAAYSGCMINAEKDQQPGVDGGLKEKLGTATRGMMFIYSISIRSSSSAVLISSELSALTRFNS